MRVLIATDGSLDATIAMRAAGRLLTSVERQVEVLFVAPAPRALNTGKINAEKHQERIAADTRRVLRDAKTTLAEEGIDAALRCRSGSPVREILREAVDYDITVIGAKGRNARSEGGLGPVASRLVEHGSGCVLIGRELPSEKGVRILVAVDGSSGSARALDQLNSFFDLGYAEITLLHVIETLWLPPKEDQTSGESDLESMQTDQLLMELRREAEQLLLAARDRIVERHPGVTTSIREGVPGNEILSEADQGDYDLVVVGASEATDMKHTMLGSVSSKVAWNAPCSVLVVRLPA